MKKMLLFSNLFLLTNQWAGTEVKGYINKKQQCVVGKPMPSGPYYPCSISIPTLAKADKVRSEIYSLFTDITPDVPEARSLGQLTDEGICYPLPRGTRIDKTHVLCKIPESVADYMDFRQRSGLTPQFMDRNKLQ
ncbi:hypothetical protein A3F66_05125 [candidate division TM6 bacterium RIFCSPHIGHO2_12_FULL_32_22]|nr:MAG: hypothetical protein A3F66_05125 [candidate division TM6 bacterium RIFCSPHIGHO2_12_FULL_32_22]